MALTAGKKLGPYEILAPLGAGGMGEVYRCRDTRLGRDVAIKVLPQHLSTNSDVRMRFEREAKSISSLNHPNICTLYDIGREGDTDYLVMELVEGETLAHRIAKGALSLDQTLKIGIEVADALARAHRAGIVHRDLKPGNVMLTKTGAKLMDFGLARAILSESPSSSSGITMTALPHSPSADRSLTAEGTIVGTFMYMAPEQLEGKDADARSDLWALGCVIYEMVTGKKAFEGKSQASLIGAIMNAEPRGISELAPLTPPALQHTVKSCLAKDPEERIQTARDVMLELRWIAEGGSQAGVAAPVAARRKARERTAWILAALMTLATAGLAIGQWTMRPPPPQMLQFEIPPPPSIQAQDSPRISPDGLNLAYTATDSTGTNRIWVRPLAGSSAQALAGTEGANRPFWSPDSRFLGFIADGKLKKIPVSGGPTLVICDAETGADGSWSKEGVILFDGNAMDPIRRVSASGGLATDVVLPDSTAQVGWPEFLPDGRHFLYLSIEAPSMLCVGDLRSKEIRRLGPCESQVQFVKPGYLLFSRSGSLVIQRFDSRALKLTGEPIPIAEQVTSSAIGASDFRASDNGILVYSTRRAQLGDLVEINREGRRLRILSSPPTSLAPALSPDERRIALRAIDDRTKTRDLWLIGLDREMMTRLTFDPTHETQPLWSPDGKRIAFWSDRPGSAGVYVKQLTGSGQEELLHLLPNEPSLSHWSRDGSRMLFTQGSGQRSDIWVLELSGERKAYPFLNGPFTEREGQLSPNGKFLAYSSDESGQYQIYVQQFPDRSEKWQISTTGGSDPQWRADGKELFFLGGDQSMMSAKINSSETQFSAEVPQRLFPVVVLFPTGPRNHYVVTADGNHFYVIVPKGSDVPPSTTVVVNWMKQVASS